MPWFISFGPSFDAFATALFFKNHVYRHRGPLTGPLSERDPKFMASFWRGLFSIPGTKLSPSSPYHSQINSQREIMNRKLEVLVQSSVTFGKSTWDEYLVDFEVSYDSSASATTMFTPFYINYGIDPVTIPMDLVTSSHPAAIEFLRSTQKGTEKAQRAARWYNQSAAQYVNTKHLTVGYKVGERVYLSTKIFALGKFSGFCKPHPKDCEQINVVRKLSSVSCELEIFATMKNKKIYDIFHVGLAKTLLRMNLVALIFHQFYFSWKLSTRNVKLNRW